MCSGGVAGLQHDQALVQWKQSSKLTLPVVDRVILHPKLL